MLRSAGAVGSEARGASAPTEAGGGGAYCGGRPPTASFINLFGLLCSLRTYRFRKSHRLLCTSDCIERTLKLFFVFVVHSDVLFKYLSSSFSILTSNLRANRSRIIESEQFKQDGRTKYTQLYTNTYGYSK